VYVGLALFHGKLSSVLTEAAAIGCVALQLNRWKFSSEAVVEERAHRKPGGKCGQVHGIKENMVAGVARDEFVEVA